MLLRSAYLDDSTVKRLRECVKGDALPWLPFAVSMATGLRIGDVLALRRVNVSPDGRVRFQAAKTGKIGEAKLPPELARALIDHSGGGRWCFPGRREGKHLTRQAAWARCKAAARRAGLSPAGISPHAFRKVFAVNTFRKSGNVEKVREKLQHEKLGDTMLYCFSDYFGKPKEQ